MILLTQKLYTIWEYIKEHPKCNKKELQVFTGYSYQGITNVLQKLKKKGVITSKSNPLGTDGRIMVYIITKKEVYKIAHQLECLRCYYTWTPYKLKPTRCSRCCALLKDRARVVM